MIALRGVVPVVFFGCTALAGGRVSGTPASAVLELTIAPTVGPVEEAKFELGLRNRLDRPIWVNARMALNGSGTPPGVSEVWIEIVGPSGVVSFECKVNGRFATDRDYVVLKPNEVVTRSERLRCFDELKIGGTYVARAHYHDRNPETPLAPGGIQHLSGEIVSEPVRFAVVR